MTSAPNFGWYDSPDATEPAYNPWPNAFCPHCGNPIPAKDVCTFNFVAGGGDEPPAGSFFYFTHRSCHKAATEDEREAVFRHIVSQTMGFKQ